MGRRKLGARVLGPYEEETGSGKRRWRVVQVDERGQRTTHFADSKRQAAKLVKACALDLALPGFSDPSVAEITQRFIDVKMKAQRWSKRTLERSRGDLKQFGGEMAEAPTTMLNPMWMRSYLDRISYLALASQRSRWHLVAEFLKWGVRRGYLRRNPMEEIDDTELPWLGKRARKKMGRGKPQLRNVDEVRAYLEEAATLSSPERRVGAQLPLLTGMRSGEIRHLRVGDVDFGIGRLWIRDDDDDGDDDGWEVKSASSRRTVGIPESLVADLRVLCEGQNPVEYVFRSNRGDGAWERRWLSRMIKDVCAAAGTRIVTPHGMRDTFTSLMAELGQRSVADIGRMVGHADNGQTARRHYIGVAEHQPALRLVAGGKEV